MDVSILTKIAAGLIILMTAMYFITLKDSGQLDNQDVQISDLALISDPYEEEDIILETLFADDFNYFEDELEGTDIDLLIEEHLEEFEFNHLEDLL